MSTTNLAAACLSIGLVSAWAESADAGVLTEIHYEGGMLGDVTHARVLLGGLGSGSNGSDGLIFRNLALEGMGSGFFTSPVSSEFNQDAYAMIGLSGDGSGFHHLVLTTPGLTILNGMLFEDLFPGVSEAVLIDQLLTDNPAADDFLRTNFAVLRTPDTMPATCYSFSAAQPFGTLTIDIVSVPAPALAGFLPVLLLAHRRRRS